MSANDRFTEVWDALDPFDAGYPHLWIKAEHLGRYLFAARFLASEGVQTVADLGCGTGYGSAELAGVADQIFAVDGDSSALQTAAERYPNPAVNYLECSLGREWPSEVIPVRPIDAAVCFETLEHLVDPGHLLHDLADLIRPGGSLIVSVPNSVFEGINDEGLPANRLHRRTYTVTSITELIERASFTVDDVLGQPLAAAISRNETRLIRRKHLDGRIGDVQAFHEPETIRRLALVSGYPEARDIERSYSIVVVARRDGVSDRDSTDFGT